MSDSAQGPDWYLASDGKWYPPAPPEVNNRPPNNPQWSSRPAKSPWRGCLIAAIVGLVLLLLSGAVIVVLLVSGGKKLVEKTKETISEQTGPLSAAAKDASIASCGLSPNELSGAEASVTVINTSAKTSNYVVTVNFVSQLDGKRIDVGTATISSVQPGASGTAKATSFNNAIRTSGTFDCQVGNVLRLGQ